MKDSEIIDGEDIDKKRIIEALGDMENFKPNTQEKRWESLLRKIPLELRSVLLAELSSGNSIDSIQNSNWPQQGSIVVSLNDYFKKENKRNTAVLKYRVTNDPHYWNAEICQRENEIDHLLIT